MIYTYFVFTSINVLYSCITHVHLKLRARVIPVTSGACFNSKVFNTKQFRSVLWERSYISKVFNCINTKQFRKVISGSGLSCKFIG